MRKPNRLFMHDLYCAIKNPEGYSIKTALGMVEKYLIMYALLETGNNNAKAAEILKCNRTTLICKRKRLGLRVSLPELPRKIV